MPVRMMTPPFRASYVKIWQPGQDMNGNEYYGLSMIFDKDKTPKEEMDKIRKCISDALAEKWGADAKKWPRQLKICLRDADTEDRSNKESANYDPAYVNSFFMNAKSGSRPGVVNENVEPIIDENEFYSGCYARATVTFKAYDKGGGKGVGCYIQNIMKVGDGERLGGAPPAEEDFASFRSASAPSDAAADFIGS